MEKLLAILGSIAMGALIGRAIMILYFFVPPLWHFVLNLNYNISGIFGLHDKSTIKHITIASVFITPMLKYSILSLVSIVKNKE